MRETDVSNRGVARKLRFDPNYFFVGARHAGDQRQAKARSRRSGFSRDLGAGKNL
jgi:hypothetical protein